MNNDPQKGEDIAPLNKLKSIRSEIGMTQEEPEPSFTLTVEMPASKRAEVIHLLMIEFRAETRSTDLILIK